jgi:hypothetical protein
MKNIRHNTIRNSAIAIVALAGLAVATTACFGNSSNDSVSRTLDATIEAVADQPESAAKVTSSNVVSSVTAKVESAAPTTAAPSTAAPTTEAPETESAPSTEAPTTTTPAVPTPSTPGIVLLPTIRFVTFEKDGLNISTSILVEEGGAGRNDIVSVEMSYTKFGVSRTVAATQASSTTTSSLWLIDGLMLRVGDTVTIHAVDSRGNTDDTTATVELSTSMG